MEFPLTKMFGVCVGELVEHVDTHKLKVDRLRFSKEMRPCGPDSSTSIAPPRTACRPAAPRDHAPGHTQLTAGEPARSPVCRNLFHHLNLEIALGDQLLQPRILGLELLQAPDVIRHKAADCASCRSSAC